MLELDTNSQLIILGRLDIRDILACKLVNTGWYNLIRQLWRFVITHVSVPADFPDLQVPVFEQRLRAILRSLGPSLVSLRIAKLRRTFSNSYACESIAGIPVMFPNLRSLHLAVPLDYASCVPIGFCRFLQCLTCDFGDVDVMLQKSKVMHQWGTVLSSLPSLTEFNLFNAHLFAPGLESASQFCTSIKKLSFVNVHIADYDAFNRFLRKCSNLSEFSFMDISDGDGQLRVDALSNSLSSLHLRSVWPFLNIRQQSIRRIWSHFEGLKNLTLSSLALKAPDVLGMCAFSDLKYLDLSQNYCNSIGIRTIALAPFKLTHLDVSTGPQLSEYILSLLAKEQNQLRVLNLSCSRSYNPSPGSAFSPANEYLTGRFLLDFILLNPNLTTLGLAYLNIKYIEEYIRGIMTVIEDVGFTGQIIGLGNNASMTADDEEWSNVSNNRMNSSSNLLIYLRGTLPYERGKTLPQNTNSRLRLSWDTCKEPFFIPEEWSGNQQGPIFSANFSWNFPDVDIGGADQDEWLDSSSTDSDLDSSDSDL